MRTMYSWRTLDGREPRLACLAARLVKRELDIVFQVLDCHLRFTRALWNRRNDFTATRQTGFSRVKVRHAVTASRHQDAPLSPAQSVDAVPSGAVTMYRAHTAPLPAGAGQRSMRYGQLYIVRIYT